MCFWTTQLEMDKIKGDSVIRDLFHNCQVFRFGEMVRAAHWLFISILSHQLIARMTMANDLLFGSFSPDRVP